jgi:hypothetical protein
MRPGLLGYLSACLGCLIALVSSVSAQTVQEIPAPAKIERIVGADQDMLVLAGTQWMSLTECDGPSLICLKPAIGPDAPSPAPDGALPDGNIATASSGDIRQAWYASPTNRYAHGVLGDAIEAGSLVVTDAAGELHEVALPEDQVFEDITPRIADLDGDGRNEVIAIRSSANGGAGIAIYGLVDGSLSLRGAGSENGRANRWLNFAGLLPRPDGGLTIYGVRTPHIGGRLFSIEFRDGLVSERNDIALDVSNHVIGSRELGLSAVGSFGGRIELVLPSQDRRRLRFPLSSRADIGLPGPIDKAVILVDGRIITAIETGRLFVIRPD